MIIAVFNLLIILKNVIIFKAQHLNVVILPELICFPVVLIAHLEIKLYLNLTFYSMISCPYQWLDVLVVEALALVVHSANLGIAYITIVHRGHFSILNSILVIFSVLNQGPRPIGLTLFIYSGRVVASGPV